MITELTLTNEIDKRGDIRHYKALPGRLSGLDGVVGYSFSRAAFKLQRDFGSPAIRYGGRLAPAPRFMRWPKCADADAAYFALTRDSTFRADAAFEGGSVVAVDFVYYGGHI